MNFADFSQEITFEDTSEQPVNVQGIVFNVSGVADLVGVLTGEKTNNEEVFVDCAGNRVDSAANAATGTVTAVFRLAYKQCPSESGNE